MAEEARGVSLLWPEGAVKGGVHCDTDDLDLDPLLRALCIDGRYERHIRAVLGNLSADAAILRYRQAVLDDVLRIPALADGLALALDHIGGLVRYMNAPQWQNSDMQQVAWRLSELERYIACVDVLDESLNAADLQAEGLRHLRDRARATADDPLFKALKAELPALLETVRGVRSITIGVNLDDELRPVEATLLAVNRQRYRGQSVIDRFVGGEGGDGIGPLHRFAGADFQKDAFLVRLTEADNPLLNPLFRDLASVMDQACRPIARALKRYVQITGWHIVGLEPEIAFYLGAARLVRQLEARGLPTCRADLAAPEARAASLRDFYNINLALRMDAADSQVPIIANDLDFGPDGRILIVTGPNRGGKTTYTQAVGLAQVMLQAGLPVPARSACMSPVDGIYTHFATAEDPGAEAGRLGEEAARLSAIFTRATANSLILLNESLASTSAGESFYLARDLARALRLLGARAIFATHLHELAAQAETINAESEGDAALLSMVAQVQVSGDNARRTFKIVPGPPLGSSYAREIAARYGLSFDQLAEVLRQRGAVKMK